MSPPKKPDRRDDQSHLEVARFLGVSLSGGKNEKTALACLEYYPRHQKLFLSEILDSLGTEGEVSGDAQLCETMNGRYSSVKTVAFDIPLSLPICLNCPCTVAGFENCTEEHILWMWEHYRQKKSRRKNTRLFTPYTERCIEMHLSDDLEEPFAIQGALGANHAPLTARAQFLLRRLKWGSIEVQPRVSVWRIGSTLKVAKSQLRTYRQAMRGPEARESFLTRLVARKVLFLYQQDIQKMVDQPTVFDAFICALTAYLDHQGQCEVRPDHFPRCEAWVSFPKKDFEWRSIG